jgi:hypothetical protein
MHWLWVCCIPLSWVSGGTPTVTRPRNYGSSRAAWLCDNQRGGCHDRVRTRAMHRS